MIMGTRVLIDTVDTLLLASLLKVAELAVFDDAARQTSTVTHLGTDLVAGGLGGGTVGAGSGLSAVGDVVGGHGGLGEGQGGGDKEGLELHFLVLLDGCNRGVRLSCDVRLLLVVVCQRLVLRMVVVRAGQAGNECLYPVSTHE